MKTVNNVSSISSISISVQRLRNLTTGILHTKMDDIYKDISLITGEPGVMTHMLPAACRALKPFLEKRLDESFWDNTFNTNNKSSIEILPLSEEEKKEFFNLFSLEIGKTWNRSC